MDAQECCLHLQMSRKLVNLLTSLMPSMEGLFLASVTDGKLGLVTLRFDASVAHDVNAMVQSLKNQYPDEVQLIEEVQTEQ